MSETSTIKDGIKNRNPRDLRCLLVTGGAGFIGSNFIHYLFEQTNFSGTVINLDKLTYAGNPENLKTIEGIGEATEGTDNPKRYIFLDLDICDYEKVEGVFQQYPVDGVVHFAAESHVDRSIHGPRDFINTNILGTFNLLEAARKHWQSRKDVLFHHISTDEVYGSLGDTGLFREDTPYDPRSPYSASKASSDHLVSAYFHTYGLPVTISNCSNNYGPYQFPEKLIPLMILNAREGKPLPVYGQGSNIRDWLYVEDHCAAIHAVIRGGTTGETYNIGGQNELTNIDVVHRICDTLEQLCPLESNPAARKQNPRLTHYKDLVTFVKDRPGHDFRYAIDCGKIEKELGWTPRVSFGGGLEKTIRWYLDHPEWVQRVRSGEYRQWISRNYQAR